MNIKPRWDVNLCLMNLVFVILFMAVSVEFVYADTVIINNGSFTFTGTVVGFGPPASGRLIGSGLDLDFGVRDGGPDCFQPACLAGESHAINAGFSNELARGSARIPGEFTDFNFVRSFNFTGPSIDIPHTTQADITFTGPFNFTGHVPVEILTPPARPHVVEFDLIGSGTFTLSLHQVSTGVFAITTERFDFQVTPAAIPEPATWGLLTFGSFALILLKKWRGIRSQSE